jgi:hypothetical protein
LELSLAQRPHTNLNYLLIRYKFPQFFLLIVCIDVFT